MALWYRIGPTKLLSHRCRRWYSLLYGAAGGPLAGRADGPRGSRPLEIPPGSLMARPGASFGRSPVRSFAAPVQAKPKPSGDSASGPRINGAITSAFVRLVTDEGHGIVSRLEALDRAKKLNLDLVEVQRTAKPPVCKIMDFHKEKFKQVDKEKERAKSKSAITLRNGENKEVRFKAKTELKDLKTKAETVMRLMERGYRVKCTAIPTGKEEEDLGGLLSRLLALIEDVSIVESGPHMDTKQAYVIVRHAKFTTKKPGKKVSDIVEAVSRGVQSAVPNAAAAVSGIAGDEMPPHGEEEHDPIECSSEAENEVSSLKVTSNGKSNEVPGWSEFHRPNNSNDIFDIDAKRNTVSSGVGGGRENLVKPFRPKRPTASVGGGIPASKPGLGSLKDKMEIKKEPTNIGNRYSKPNEPMGGFQKTNSSERSSMVPGTRAVPNQGRMPQEATGYGTDRRGPLDPKQRQIHPSNPSSPSPSNRIFGSPTTAGSGDRSKLGGAATSNSSERSFPSQTYGNFSASKTTATEGQKNSGDATMGKPNDRGLPARNYGIFSAPKTTGDQGNSGNTNTGKPSNPSSPPAHGIFGTTKTVSSGDQRDMGDATVGNPRDPGSSASRYGIFSTIKPSASGDQRNLGGAKSGAPGKVSP